MVDYEELARQLGALAEGVPYEIANLSNAAALLWEHLPDINWVGFYKMIGGELILYPFQGKPACIRITLDRGVCGAAAREDRVQRVEDVHLFPGHIACDCASNSEIVVPLHRDGEVWGVLDIDSPLVGRFSEADQSGLERVARVIEDKILPAAAR